MAVVDSHAHIWGEGFLPKAFFQRAAEQWAAKADDRTAEMILPKLLSGVEDPNGDDFVANMDQAGVDRSFIMMIDVGAPVFGEEPRVGVDQQIEFYSALQRRHKNRLHCHVSVDFRRAGYLDAIRRGVKEYGLVGIGELTPDGFSADGDNVRPMFELAADLGVPVQIHTRAGVWTDFAATDYSEANPVHPVHVAHLARAIPDLKIVLCHAGFPAWWQVAAEAVADLPNCVLDVSNWNEPLDEHPGDLVGRVATWRSLVGTERILFASDQVSGKRFTGERSTLPRWVDFFRDLPANAAKWGYRFSAEEAAQILGGNALKFYNLS
jgi:predicted TIM-barrel fold metal-dependent hydrolase